jgi:hypothetical protein
MDFWKNTNCEPLEVANDTLVRGGIMVRVLIRGLALSLWVLFMGCIEGPMGPEGPAGPRGLPGQDGQDGKDGADIMVSSTTGTIYNKHYETTNTNWAAIRLPGATYNRVVLFVGIENPNGVFVNTEWTSSIYSDGDDGFNVDGYSGYYVLVWDPDKDYLNKNYKVQYIK